MQLRKLYNLFKFIIQENKKESLIKKNISAIFIALAGIQGVFAQASSYEEADFNRLEPGRLNISVYVFNDRNRNGIYDLGDAPMAGIRTELVKPSGRIATGISNKNGYANYKMSLGSDKHKDIEKGNEIYEFKVIEPPNWRITTGNAIQKILFLNKVGSPGGLVADKAPNWVGLAPELFIKGKLVGPNNAALPKDASVTFQRSNRKSKRLRLRKDGSFLLSVDPGMWSIVFESASSNWKLKREVIATNVPIEMIDVSVGQKYPPPQEKLIIENFDWIKNSKLEKIPNGHNGLNWDYLLAMHHQNSSGPGYINVLKSGHAVAYNSSGHPVKITSKEGEVFDFIGGYFTAAWAKANGEILKLEAFRSNKRVAIHELKLSHLGATWLDANLRSIDKLIFSTKHYWQFGTDDMHFRLPKATIK